MSLNDSNEISALLHPDRICVGLEADSKEAVLSAMVELLGQSGVTDRPVEVLSAIMKREQVLSTGVGSGLALPHAKTEAVADNAVAFATLSRPVDYGALDDKPVELVFMLVGPAQAKNEHIRLLGRLSRLMIHADFRQQLGAAEDAEDVIRLFEEGESHYFV